MAKLLTAESTNGDPIVINFDKVLFYKPDHKRKEILLKFSHDLTRTIKYEGDFTGMLKRNGIDFINQDL